MDGEDKAADATAPTDRTVEAEADAIRQRPDQCPSRPAAAAVLLGALAAFGIGTWLYAAFAPSGVHIIDVELGGRGQLDSAGPMVARHADVAQAVWWDFAFIAGYGALLFLGARAAKWVFWTRQARSLAKWAPIVAGTTVVADVVENVFLLIATGHPRQSGTWLDLASAAAVLKFSALIPALLVAVLGLLLAAWRLASWPVVGRKWHVEAAQPDQMDLGVKRANEQTRSGRPIENPCAQGASRWRDGYNVPEIDGPEDIAKRLDEEGKHTVGFCVSGGGIRSASVAMGALQTLRERLLSARYLVSVSGGGYTAGAFQLALTPEEHPPTAQPATSSSGSGVTRTVVREPKHAFGDGSAEQDHVRRHSSYLADTSAQLVVALGKVARGLLASLAVLFAPAIVLGALVGFAYRYVPVTDLCRAQGDKGCRVAPNWGHAGGDLPFPTPRVGAVWVIVAFAALAVVVWTIDLGWKSLQSYEKDGEKLRRDVGKVTAVLVQAVLLVAAVAVVVPAMIWGAAWLLSTTGSASHIAVGGPVVSVVLAYLSTLVTVGRRTKKKLDGLLKSGGKAPQSMVQRLLMAVTLILLAAAWLLLFAGVASVVPQHPLRDKSVLIAACVAAGVVLVLGVLLDETALSLHPFYRRQIASAFAVRAVEYKQDGKPGRTRAEPYPDGEWTTLSTYGKRVDGFPQVIFATAANLTGQNRTAPGLNAVSFTMSGDWIGSPDLGWLRTSYAEDVCAPLIKRDLTVQAAVAISGAAFSSAMGRQSRWYSTLLALSGARLGTWLPNPSFVIERQRSHADWTIPALPSVRRLPYLIREVFGIHPFEERMVQVTDGGGYDNLGLVELLRRRCTQIFCIDASGDTPPTATTLAEAIRLAHDELGVVIELDEAYGLEPGKGKPLDPAEPFKDLNARLSDTPVLTARITYPPQAGFPGGRKLTGQLIFAKAMLWPDLPYQVLSYAAKHGIFPHDSTSDQWFDEGQFSAYTELGRRIGDRANAAADQLASGVHAHPNGQRRHRRGGAVTTVVAPASVTIRRS